MIKNSSIQDQIIFSFIQMNIVLSLSKRFIFKKNLQFIHDSIFINVTSNWEQLRLSEATTLASNYYTKGA